MYSNVWQNFLIEIIFTDQKAKLNICMSMYFLLIPFYSFRGNIKYTVPYLLSKPHQIYIYAKDYAKKIAYRIPNNVIFYGPFLRKKICHGFYLATCMNSNIMWRIMTICFPLKDFLHATHHIW